jgi:hypothetical protein
MRGYRDDAQRARALFAEIDPVLDRDPALARRVVEGLRKAKASPKSSNRRAPAAIDPFAIHRADPSALRPALQTLDIEQLKDIVSQYAMDPRKLALKWRTSDRLIDLITEVVDQRSRKGEAFRSEATRPTAAP